MLSSFLLLSTALLSLSVPASAISGAQIINGRTYLLGNSFGVPGINASYDYIIIGGGTAGLTLANRLSANSTVSVAVIEAGGFYETHNGNKSQVPAYGLQGGSSDIKTTPPTVDWGIVTAPQAQFNGRQLRYAQGKSFGGSSARNVLAYHRGTVGAFKQWADLAGDDSYEWDSVLPYFQKSVKFSEPNYAKRDGGGQVTYDTKAFSDGGPLDVSYSNWWSPQSTFTRQAFNASGLAEIPGLSSGDLMGYSEFTNTLEPDTQVRSSSETSFMMEMLEAGEETVQFYESTIAQKILFDGTKASGVALETDNLKYTLSANKEVILSAGAFRSPQLLMLSGVGPEETLSNLNIPSVSKLDGVGQGLWDQAYYAITFKVNVSTQYSILNTPSLAAQAKEDYLGQQKGPLTLPGGSIVGFEKLPAHLRSTLSNSTLKDLATFPSDWPELELLPVATTAAPVNGTFNYMSFTVAQIAPTSRGNVTINSTDAKNNPIISPNWLSTTTDQEVAVAAIKRAREIMAKTGIVEAEILPGPAVQTDAQILAYLKATAVSIHHASVSNRMGKQEDGAVVDATGKVYGTQGLRVVDASSFALLPPGHSQATVYMLAEKIADDILNGR